jgi:tRNA threonylcarbamoyladenosine biosynthesis protein TsaB
MIVLGIDTSGYINAVGVINTAHSGVSILADNRFPARTDTLEQIVDNIDVTLKQAGISLKDVDGIGVGLGPGSWTGIKVGVTVGKMLAFSAGKPVAGISTLDALAFSARGESLPVYTIVNAGVKDMVYAACYRYQENEPVREGEYYAGDISGLAKIIKEPVILTGHNAAYYARLITRGNEPVGDKSTPENRHAAENILHNVITKSINEPAGTVGVFTSTGSDNSYKSDDFPDNTNILHNEPAQSGNSNENYGIYVKTIEIETAGASVACLAALRLKRGQAGNPLSLTPLYLKESTAKVFINKYLGNKDT